MAQVTLWKGLGADFSPDPIHIDDLIGKRMRASGHKGTRTRGRCTFASTDRGQAECYMAGPKDLATVLPQPGSILTWSPNGGDLILAFEEFLRREQWEDAHWASRRAREILMDVYGCISTFERYLINQPRSRAVVQIVDCWLQDLSIKEIVFEDYKQMTSALDTHSGEVWVTGPCQVARVSQTTDLETPAAA